MNATPENLRQALRDRVVVADGGMGTMLQAAGPTLEDFEGHDGCNEILNVTRPDVVCGVHDAYLAAGADAVETNTFGANWANLGEYGLADRIEELAGADGAGAARVRRRVRRPAGRRLLRDDAGARACPGRRAGGRRARHPAAAP